MKKLLLVPVILAMSSGFAFAQSAFTGIANSFGGGFTANATVSQSVANLNNSWVQQHAFVVQNSPNLSNSRRGISGSFLGGFNAGATVNQSANGVYNGGQVLQNTQVFQNSPVFGATAP